MKPRKPLPPELAGRPFSSAQGLAAGITRGRMRGRDLDQPFRGVNIPAGAEPDLETRCSALATRLPANAFFCGVTAAQLTGLPMPRELESERTIHLAVPSPRTAPTGRGIRGRSVRVHASDVQRRGSF